AHCSQVKKATSSLYFVAVLSTTLLFYYRLRTVFLDDWFISAVFGFLGLCVVGGCTTVFPGISGMNIQSAKHCTISPLIEPYVSAFLIGPLLDTSLIFIFIAARLVERCRIDFSAKDGLGKFIFVDCTSVLWQGLLQEGQTYYL
ncbi:hypothetical protein BDZ97DRAFT_1662399, partial [Flammula alnicola]